MKRRRSKWSGAQYGTGLGGIASMTADDYGRQAFVRALRSSAPGQWTDDRLEQTRHLVGVTYVAVRALAEQAAGATAHAYRLRPGAKDGADKDAREPVDFCHPLSRILRCPNNKETGSMLRRRLVQQLCLTGSALLWRLDHDDDYATPGQLWTIPTATAQAVPRSQVYPQGAYRITPMAAYGPFAMMPGLMATGSVLIPADEIIRIDLPHPLFQYDAYSPLTACALQLDALEATDRSRERSMKQSLHPSATLELDPTYYAGDLSQETIDRLKQELSDRYGGEHNVGRAAVLPPGMVLRPWASNHKDMGWESAWAQLSDFVLSVFGISKSLSFMSEATAYASLYAALKQFNLFTMVPLLGLIADAINVQMVWPKFGEDYFIELEPRKIDDEDLEERRLATDISIGLRTINEIRVLRGFEPVPWGDVRAFPGNMQQAQEQKLEDTDPANDKPGPATDGVPRESLLDAAHSEADPRREAAEVARLRPRHRLGVGSLPGRLWANGSNA